MLSAGDGLTVQPMVNQIQLHTRLAQEETVRYCHDHNIVVTAFCPLSGSDLEDPVVRDNCNTTCLFWWIPCYVCTHVNILTGMHNILLLRVLGCSWWRCRRLMVLHRLPLSSGGFCNEE